MERNCVLNHSQANALLSYLRIVCDEDSVALNDVEIIVDEHHDGFGYTPIDKQICMTEKPLIGTQDEFIINYMNEEFDLNLKNIPLTRAIHAILHELGHHMDMINMTKEELVDYIYEYREYDIDIKLRTYDNAQILSEIKDTIEELINDYDNDEVEEETYFIEMDKLTALYTEARKERMLIDKAYRLNPAERRADAFAAKMFKKYLINIMPQIFEGEVIVNKLDDIK